MSAPSGNFTAQQLDDMFHGAGDATSAFIMSALFGASMNVSLQWETSVVVIQAFLSSYVIHMAFDYLFGGRVNRDPIIYKIMIVWFVIVNITGIIVGNYELHYTLNNQYQVKNHFQTFYSLMHVTLAMPHTTTVPTQLFYGYKAYLLWNRSWLVAGLTLALVIGNTAVKLVTDIEMVTLLPDVDWPNVLQNIQVYGPELMAYGHRIKMLIQGLTVSLAIGEAGITALLFVAIFKTKSNWKSTQNMMRRISFFLAESMLPTVILHIVGLISTFAPGSGTTTLPRAIAAFTLPIQAWSILYALLARDKEREISARERSTHMHGKTTNGGVSRHGLGTMVEGGESSVGLKSQDDRDYFVLSTLPKERQENKQYVSQTGTNGVIIETEEFTTLDDGSRWGHQKGEKEYV